MWAAAAALAPVVAGAMQSRPRVPGLERMDLGYGNYADQMIESAYNPQSELFNLSNAQHMGNINSQLARLGLGTSSAGLQAHRAGSSELANRFLEGELDRRRQALAAATQYRQAEYGVGVQNRAALMDQYKAKDDANRGLIRGIGAIGGVATDMYGAGQARDQRVGDQNFMREMLERQQYGYSPTFGVPFSGGYPQGGQSYMSNSAYPGSMGA